MAERLALRSDDIVCAVAPESTNYGWAQDGSPCPCPPCGEMRLRWLQTIDTDDSIATIQQRVNVLVADYRAIQRCLIAVREQVAQLERERDNESVPFTDLDETAVRKRLFRREEFISTFKEALEEWSEEIKQLSDDIDQEITS